MATELRRRPARRLLLPGSDNSPRHALSTPARLVIAFVAAAALLFVLQYAAFAATRIAVELAIHGQEVQVRVDGHIQHLQLAQSPTQLVFVPGSPLLREYQIDGTDDTNNFTEDAGYVTRMTDRPYFAFQNWMRDEGSYSTWRDVTVQTAQSGQATASGIIAQASSNVTLPGGTDTAYVTASLMRLEMPAEVLVVCGDAPCAVVTLNRNDRYVRATVLLPDGTSVGQSQAYFPVQALPFAAEVVYLLAHVALWALALLCVLFVVHAAVSSGATLLRKQALATWSLKNELPVRRWRGHRRLRPRDWDRLAALVIALSFGFTCYIALVQYQAEPHILDASAYVMQAKIFASGRLAAPVPADLGPFQGPFMVAHDGRWFAQYAPGTSLILAVGILLHLPWLVEPLLGSLALWGLYLLGRAWYGRTTAWLAVALGALSPFYSYLAASYLSHVPALFFEVFFLLSLTRYTQRARTRDITCAAACWSGLLLTRELSAALLGLAGVAFFGYLSFRRHRGDQERLRRDGLLALAVALGGCALYLIYNLAQTGSALMTPRALFSPADRMGFGPGIGFYGQHTVAAGLVNLDELLTSLSIDLFGWPMYLTLIFIPIAFLGRRAHRQWDVFSLGVISLLVLAQVAYFYHGVYLGPRYLFETLPFLLLLTARGMIHVPRLLTEAAARLLPAGVSLVRRPARMASVAAIVALVLCNLLYYLPRQIATHQNFSGLPVTQPVDVEAIYRQRPPHAIIITSDWYLYNYVTWPLNDPTLSGTTLYAFAPSPDAISAIAGEYPGRTLFELVVAQNGNVQLVPIHP